MTTDMTNLEALYDAATEAYNDAAEAQAEYAHQETAPWSDGIRAAVDVVLDAHPAERPDFEVLREAAALMWDVPDAKNVRSALRREAARLEVAHHAAEAAREKLIHRVAARIHRVDRGTDDPTCSICLERARALAADDLLAAPETTDGGAR